MAATIRRSVVRSGVLLSLLAAIMATCGSAGMAADDPQISDVDKQFLAQSPAILQYLRDKGYKNVGVLKFRIKKGKEPVSDSVGTLNTYLADRLEVALVLANPNAADKQMGIIGKASSVAATIPGAGHVTAEGRKKLFDKEYPLAWGTATVKPDAFLTGVVAVTADLKQMTVGILAFDANSEQLDNAVPVFTAATAGSQVAELGESFVLRGAFDQASPKVVKPVVASNTVVDSAAKVKAASDKHPLQNSAAPVALEVRYDDKPVSIEFREGKAFVAEPQEGQKVALIIKRTDATKARLGVVVKVNGENTLFREKLRDADCRKWILGPSAGPTTILGYQADSDVAEEFRVLSKEASKASEVNYGTDVGMISLTVFKEKEEAKPGTTPTPAPPSDLPDDTAEDLAALTRGVMPAQKPKNLAALKFQLREGGRKQTETRGLIQQGAQTASKTATVSFNTDPTPVMSAAVIYYKP